MEDEVEIKGGIRLCVRACVCVSHWVGLGWKCKIGVRRGQNVLLHSFVAGLERRYVMCGERRP